MKDTKLTVRVSRDLLENVKVYAEKNNTTLTELIESFLKNIPSQFPLENAPIVRRLSGSLPKNLSIQDYRDHLEDKYGQ
ncbi:MAG: hypothetical protein K0B14_13605 [Anaerolineaceae bacterium]|jgi:hypothetical protein|nr:hypothetical protein [Anaerolineaceae bacterium]PKO05515.1 MAG: hypothetical protein CVU41_12880 [Chloroflexi bacterium HGW-Chloroflexi-3]